MPYSIPFAFALFTKALIFLLIKINVKYGRESFIASKIIIYLSLSSSRLFTFTEKLLLEQNQVLFPGPVIDGSGSFHGS